MTSKIRDLGRDHSRNFDYLNEGLIEIDDFLCKNFNSDSKICFNSKFLGIEPKTQEFSQKLWARDSNGSMVKVSLYKDQTKLQRYENIYDASNTGLTVISMDRKKIFVSDKSGEMVCWSLDLKDPKILKNFRRVHETAISAMAITFDSKY